MYIKISGLEFGHIKFAAVVLADDLEEVQKELEDVMIISAQTQEEFEEKISDMGFEIINKECEIEGETFVIIIDKQR